MSTLVGHDGPVEVHRSDEAVEIATRLLVTALRERLAVAARASLALSGGRSPWPAFEALALADLPWDRVDVYQVDERVAPDGHDDRNLTGLRRVLLDRVPARAHAMPVTEPDLDAAAAAYAAALPAELDVVHLGLGDDGHTASLVPGDTALDVVDRTVAISGEYQGRRRMTLTSLPLHRARQLLWFVTGAAKAEMLDRLLRHDATIPAGRIAADRAAVVTDIDA